MGPTCVGKTYYIKKCIEQEGTKYHIPNALGVYPGQACREKYGTEAFVKSENPVAPEFNEAYVREIVEAAASSDKYDTLLVDGMPRSPDQVAWLRTLGRQYGARVEILYCVCKEPEWMGRRATRSQNEEDARLIARRLEKEGDILLGTLLSAMQLGVSVRVIDLANGGPVVLDRTDESSTIHDLRVMFDDHKELANLAMVGTAVTSEYLLAAGQPSTVGPISTTATWARRLARCAIEELQELIEELPDKWWSKDDADLVKARIELIDVWHFMMSLSFALGMDAEQFAQLYYVKADINRKRWTSGSYSKRNK